MYIFVNLVIVFLLGFLVGLTEILGRYKETRYLLITLQFWFYIIFNGFVSIIAFLLLIYFNEDVVFETLKTLKIEMVIIAGFGGMLVLRSSLFSVKHKGDKIEIGLAAILQILMDTLEKKMASRAAVLRLDEMNKIMENVNFEKAKEQLSSLCISSIDNFSEEDKESLLLAINAVKDLNENKSKSIQLGMHIARHCDKVVVEKAIEVLNGLIMNDPVQEGEMKSVDEDNIEYWIDKFKN